MGRNQITTGLIAFGLGAGILSVSAAPASSRMLGGAQRSFSINDLPNSALRAQLESLPAPAQTRAAEWLQTFEFPPEDVSELHVDHEGGVLYTCEFPAVENSDAIPEPLPLADPSAAPIPVVPFPDSSKFHSRPGSTNIIFLDFDGHVVVGTAWNNSLGRTQIVARAYSTDSDAATFSDTEQANIKRIWQRVAEDFAPFDVDVTTETPPAFHSRVAHCLITRNTDVDGNPNPSSTAGGVAYVGIFAGFNAAYSSPAWVYHNNLSNSEANTAEAASHEIGHNLGLSHDGILNGAAYYNGHGTGVTSWGPIMGTGYGRNVSQWSRGEYYQANNTQDDLAIIAGKLSYRPDDVVATLMDAPFIQLASDRFIQSTTPETDPSAASTANKGVLASSDDLDTWAFVSGAGTISISARPWIGPSGTRGGNLDIKLELLNTQGVVLASSDVTTETIATVTATVDAGLYYLRIQNASFGNPTSSAPTGFTTYGSIGQYFITGVVANAAAVVVPPSASAASLPVVTAAGAPQQFFSIRYADNTGIDTSSLDDQDLTVTGPNGFSAAAFLVAVDTTSNGTPRFATYRFTPPGGSWDLADNGAYSISMNEAEVSDTGGAVVPAGVIATLVADISPFIYQATMDTNPNWTLSASWAFGKPVGSNGDPVNGATSTNVIGYNLGGRYTRNLATSYATTPVIDCAYTESVTLRFKRWLGVANGDTASLQVRSESNTWTTIWSSSGAITDTTWQSIEFDITAIAAGRTNVQIRWGMASNSDSTTQFGWNIDDVEIAGIYQPASPSVTGSIRYHVLPREALPLGAGWRVYPHPDTNWLGDGAVRSGLPAGSYTVTFKPIAGWTTPTDQIVAITDETTNDIDAAYVAITTASFGVPLWWLNQYGITNDPEVAVTTVGNNGLTLWQSYIAGLDPTDPVSQFESLPPAAAPTGEDIILQWNAVSGRIYSVYRMNEPGAEAVPIPDAQNITWPQSSYTNQPGAEATGILQIRVRLP